MPTLVDSHCHINFDPLAAELAQVVERARQNGVEHLLCVSVNMEDFPQVLALARDYEPIYASVGVHPSARQGHDPSVEELAEWGRSPEIVAIGETGLDYYHCSGDLDWQRQRFRRHIRAARACGKPLIIHMRDAATDTLRIMKEEGAHESGGVMHCFADNWEAATQALDLNFAISFSGIVTFNSAGTLRDVARRVPADRLLIETDCPYLAPVPYRGKTNEPAFVRYVAACLATVRGETLDQIAEATTRNFFKFFPAAVG